MAFCPNCKREIDATALVCPHCNYDFGQTSDTARERTRGFPYGSLGDTALMISSIAAGIGMLASVFFSVILLLSGDLCSGLFLCPLAFFLCLGMMVVFMRVADL
jgi:hypothetical protein